jgi:hypothetical protein
MLGLARPGRYRLELALLDRVSGKYSTRFEEIVVEGNPQDPVERSFEPFARVEIVPEATEDPWSRPENQLLPAKSPLNIQLAIGGINVSGNPRLIGRRAMLTSRDRAFTPDRPSFVIDTPRTTHLSVITILNPPEAALNDGLVLDLFQKNLSHLLGVITRLDVPRGTARLIGLDLPERTRVFDQVDMKGIAADTLRNAITKDQSTVTLESLTRPDTRGEFFRDVLKERFEEAEKDTSGARHAIIVVSASSKFPNNSNLALSPARNCPCEVFYISFALVQHDRDDIDHMLRAYKPQVFQPATWREFREDFGRIYERLLR